MKVAVGEFLPDLESESSAWRAVADRVRPERPEVFLLGEMPFGPWMAAGEVADPASFERVCRLHESGLASLRDLGAGVVLGTRPRRHGGRPVNEAFVWTAQTGALPAHTKQYFPDEPGYHEARWFEAGDRHFRVVEAGAVRVGFLICTEVMFNEHARRYGREGAQLLAVPRATAPGSLSRWLVASRMAAIVSGCYVLSSNRGGRDAKGQAFGGCGWVIDPRGDVLCETSATSPLAFCELDLTSVRSAQAEYPCYVPELP
jgi:N-carbamoylputrescine amidase